MDETLRTLVQPGGKLGAADEIEAEPDAGSPEGLGGPGEEPENGLTGGDPTPQKEPCQAPGQAAVAE